MPTINQLSSTTSLTTSDKMVVYSQDNGDSRKATLATLISFLHDNFQEEGLVTQIVVPTPPGPQTVTLNANTQNIWLVLNPASTFGQVTVTMPPSATAFDGQEVSVSTSQTITTFGVTGSGATVAGSPGTLQAGAFVTFKYNVTVNTWYATNVGNVSSFSTIQVSTSINDGSNNEVIKIGATAGAINELTISNGSGSTGPALTATSDTTANLDLSLAGKGSGSVEVRDPSTGLYWPVVTTQSTQTLAGKTLTGPTINTPTITSPTVTGTATVAAVTLGGNISVDTNDTRKIGTSASNRLLELWANTASVVNVACSALTATTSLVASAAQVDNDLSVLGDVKATDLVGYGTASNPPTGTVGALTQRNATLASFSVTVSGSTASLKTKRYNANTVSRASAGSYTINFHDNVSTDSQIFVQIKTPQTSATTFLTVVDADFAGVTGSSATGVQVLISEINLTANTITAADAGEFRVVVIGSPDTDRTL